MKISDLIKRLQEIKREQGNMEVLIYDCENGYAKLENPSVKKNITVEPWMFQKDKETETFSKALVL